MSSFAIHVVREGRLGRVYYTSVEYILCFLENLIEFRSALKFGRGI